jgi:outer membrane protein assembly factor BamE
MAKIMRLFLALCITLSLSACSLVYRLPTRQGNVIEQKQLDQLAIGMSRDQVTFLLGTPLAASPFVSNRWDYVGYYKTPRDKVYTRTVSLYFENEKLARMEGIKPAAGASSLDPQDMNSVLNQEKKAQAAENRAEEDKNLGNAIPHSPDDPDASKLPNP